MYQKRYKLSVPFEHPLRVIFFRTEGGNEPVREWLKELPKRKGG